MSVESTHRWPPIRRRDLLATAAGIPFAISAGRAWADAEAAEPIPLSEQHHAAVNRRRRIAVQFDAMSNPGGILGMDIDQWVAYRFNYMDEPGTQIDSVWWDVNALGYAIYPSQVLEPMPHSGLQKWRDQDVDWVGHFVAETKQRDLECFWSHRLSEVEVTEQGAAWGGQPHPIKQAHPDWVIRETWWEQGLWNLAVPEVREYVVNILRELATNYDFDGFQIDFARHIPCLPPPHQWELRGHVTEFLRAVRLVLQGIAARRQRPILFATRIPRSLEGCRADGFDIAEWSRQNLVDILTLGTRSVDVDIARFRQVTADSHIKLQPCIDGHHAIDAYQYPPIEVYRGLAANWWQQGADSLITFNWSNAAAALGDQLGAQHTPPSQQIAYHEIGSPQTLRNMDKTFIVERRGGYPWAEGYLNRNDTSPLPAEIPTDGGFFQVDVRIGDPLANLAEQIDRIVLRIILHGMLPGDAIEARLNDRALSETVRDAEWKDRQIFYPRSQPSSGGADNWKVDPDQRLTRIEYAVRPEQCRVGLNRVRLALTEPAPRDEPLRLEKLEVMVRYQRNDE
jgi:hypothetical protein